ncbi:hypothetical protein Dimus_032784 [Dionaea muscipula]
MGCCVSIPNPAKQQEISALKKPLHGISTSPPRPEEETVKEVLSETPKPRAFHIPTTTQHQLTKLNPLKNFQAFEKPRWEFKSSAAVTAPSPEEISDFSELYSSLGDSFEKKEDAAAAAAAPAAQRLNRSPARGSRKCSYSGDLGRLKNEGSGCYLTERSPVRRSDPSPGRRNECGSGGGLMGRQQQQCHGKRKWDSGRRSRSPGIRNEASIGGGGGGGGDMNLGRSHSGRKTGPSPGRIRMLQSDSGRKREEKESGRTSKWETPPPNESLENPLVSLECFIFL